MASRAAQHSSECRTGRSQWSEPDYRDRPRKHSTCRTMAMECRERRRITMAYVYRLRFAILVGAIAWHAQALALGPGEAAGRFHPVRADFKVLIWYRLDDRARHLQISGVRRAQGSSTRLPSIDGSSTFRKNTLAISSWCATSISLGRKGRPSSSRWVRSSAAISRSPRLLPELSWKAPEFLDSHFAAISSSDRPDQIDCPAESIGWITPIPAHVRFSGPRTVSAPSFLDRPDRWRAYRRARGRRPDQGLLSGAWAGYRTPPCFTANGTFAHAAPPLPS